LPRASGSVGEKYYHQSGEGTQRKRLRPRAGRRWPRTLGHVLEITSVTYRRLRRRASLTTGRDSRGKTAGGLLETLCLELAIAPAGGRLPVGGTGSVHTRCRRDFSLAGGGISSARIERLAHQPPAPDLSAFASAQCHRALQKAGADSNLMQSLGERPAGNGLSGKSSESKSRTGVCSGAAAQIAALVHENNFNAAEDKIRALLRDESGANSPKKRLAALRPWNAPAPPGTLRRCA